MIKSVQAAATARKRGASVRPGKGGAGRALLPWLFAVVILALGGFSFYSKYQRHAGADVAVGLDPSPQALTAQDSAPSSDSDPSADALPRLFGVAAHKPAAKAPKVDAPPTSLKLRLLAVMASENAEDGLAIIGEQRGKEKGYRVGDAIPGDATLDQVLADRVIISRNGRAETLMLLDDKGGKAPSAGRAASARADVGRVTQTASAGPTEAVVESGDSRVLPELARYQLALNNDPQSVADLLRFRPVRQGQTLRGYRVFPGRNPTLLARAGLRVGDIITAANGVKLSSEEAGRSVIAQLASMRSLELEVLRNGKLRAVTLATQ